MSKIKFHYVKDQPHQTTPINSTIKLFNGLSQKDNSGITNKLNKKLKIQDEQLGFEETESYNIYANRFIDTVDGIKRSKLLQNLNEVQIDNDQYIDRDIDTNKLTYTIEMETGTGKTYVYLKTILELHKNYSFNKFMIVVPSVAIKLGVMSSIQSLNDHFYTDYNINIKDQTIEYDSNKMHRTRMSFLENDNLGILVINMQAFNSINKKINKEDERGRNLFNDIKDIHPIIIIDEPQKIEGTKSKISKTKQKLDEFNPLFTLKYSATHTVIDNQIYRLSSYKAEKDKLVKSIKVNTIYSEMEIDTDYIKYVAFTKDLKAKVEILCRKQGESVKRRKFDIDATSSLYELSGKLEQYKEINIKANPNKEKPLVLDVRGNEVFLEQGDVYSNLNENNIIRYQIRLAIKQHFDKQFMILDKYNKGFIKKPIKALTLFFIDKVKNVRDFDRPDTRGDYLILFDEEYQAFINDEENKKRIKEYSKWLSNISDIKRVREGYFSIDKNNNIVLDDDDKIDKEKDDENRDRAIDLILKKKNELISFEEPLTFIFSHSALREGWDNPNVFTICTLKNGNSEIAKKQELGRGLRIPVDINGRRCFDEEINVLTVIANDSYENFSKELQSSYREANNYNAESVTKDVIFNIFKHANIPQNEFTGENLELLKQELLINKIIDKKDKLRKDIDFNNIRFSSEFANKYSDTLISAFKKVMEDKGSQNIKIENGDEEQIHNERRAFVTEKEFITHYKKLFDRLKVKTIYKSKINNEDFIEDAIQTINNKMQDYKNKLNLKITYAKVKQSEYGDVHFDSSDDPAHINTITKYNSISNLSLANTIMYHTKLPRLAILKILLSLNDLKDLGNAEILEQVIEELNNLFKIHSSRSFLEQNFEDINEYIIIDDYLQSENAIFSIDKVNNEMVSSSVNVFKANPNINKSMNAYYTLDSDGELKFAKYLEEHDDKVIMFTKLKEGGFKIQTPQGNYTPDWAIVRKTNNDNELELFFIIESKWEKTWYDLTDVEKVKINCAKVHFRDVSNYYEYENLKFNWVNNIQNYINEVSR